MSRRIVLLKSNGAFPETVQTFPIGSSLKNIFPVSNITEFYPKLQYNNVNIILDIVLNKAPSGNFEDSASNYSTWHGGVSFYLQLDWINNSIVEWSSYYNGSMQYPNMGQAIPTFQHLESPIIPREENDYTFTMQKITQTTVRFNYLIPRIQAPSIDGDGLYTITPSIIYYNPNGATNPTTSPLPNQPPFDVFANDLNRFNNGGAFNLQISADE